MKCPSCKTANLQLTELDRGPKALACTICSGRWIRSYHYWKWREKHGRSLPEKPAEGPPGPPKDEPARARLCPECGHLLARYPVGHGVPFQLERCGHCGGTWFDADEWETLAQRNLHDDVHLIFSTVWQASVRDEDRRRSMEQLRIKTFGERDYMRMKEIRDWIRNHPKGEQIRAFLMDDDL